MTSPLLPEGTLVEALLGTELKPERRTFRITGRYSRAVPSIGEPEGFIDIEFWHGDTLLSEYPDDPEALRKRPTR